MRHYLPELIALPLLPLLIMQGRRTRRMTPRMPEAGGPAAGIAGAAFGGDVFSLLTLGESPVAGVGVATHEEAISGQLAHALATRLRRPIAWRAYGKNGATARDALEQVVPRIHDAPVDLALIAFGVNDTTVFNSVTAWRRDLLALLSAVDAKCAPQHVILSGVPPIADFPALPQPLRWVMGIKARTLDLAARELASTTPQILHVPLLLDARDRTMMAEDGYHPSARGCVVWARLLADAHLSR